MVSEFSDPLTVQTADTAEQSGAALVSNTITGAALTAARSVCRRVTKEHFQSWKQDWVTSRH